MRDASKFPAAQEFSRAPKVIFLLYKHYHATPHSNVSCIMFQDIIVLCSIDYGVGTGGTRNICGNSVLHEVLENEIASLNKRRSTIAA